VEGILSLEDMGCVCSIKKPETESSKEKGPPGRFSAITNPEDKHTLPKVIPNSNPLHEAPAQEISRNRLLRPVDPSPRLGSVLKSIEGEQVAAGWPAWLAAVAGEAIKGWIPRRADSFEKMDKVLLKRRCNTPFSLSSVGILRPALFSFYGCTPYCGFSPEK
jgi:hypothetical protein